jgi:hypothetical protein
MPKNQDKRVWSDQEIEYLKVGFQMNVRLKVIAKILKRSETSINKALSRFGVRAYGLKERLKSNKRALSSPSAETYKRALDKHCQKVGYTSFFPPLKKQHKPIKKPKHNGEKNYLSLHIPLEHQYPWTNHQPALINYSNNWVDFECAVTLLEEIGDRVNYSNANFRKKAIFINGKPFTAQQMLLRLNRLRVQSGLDPLYVASVTEF